MAAGLKATGAYVFDVDYLAGRELLCGAAIVMRHLKIVTAFTVGKASASKKAMSDAV